MGGVTDLLEQRDNGLSWLILLVAALAFGAAALLPIELALAEASGLRPDPWEEDLWRFAAGAPSGWVSLAGLVWGAVTLWVVRGTRLEGEPPESAATLLSFAVTALLAGCALAAADLAGVAVSLSAPGIAALAAWGGCALAFGPWRLVDALTNNDPGHRLERVWQLHDAAGRLLALGALAPMLVVLLWEHAGVVYSAGDPNALVATLAMLALVGVSLAAVAARYQPVAAGLDDARLGLADLPPQPARRRLPAVFAAAGIGALVLSGLGVAPWPEAAAVQQQLADAGLAAPADGRSRWMVVTDRGYRKLVDSGVVRVDVAPTGAHVAATVRGPNPGFWVLWERLGWYPQQLRDLWNISELDFAPGGQQMLVGRQRGLLQLRAFPSGKEDSPWHDHSWAPIWPTAGRVRYIGDTPHALHASGDLKAWSAAAHGWETVHRFSTVPQGMAASPDGTRLAVSTHSYRVEVYELPSFTRSADLEVRGVRELVWASDTALLAVGQGVERIDVETGARERLFDEPVLDAALASDGRRLALASYDVSVLDLETRTVLLDAASLAVGGAASVSWHPEGSMLAVGSTAGTLELLWLQEHRWEKAPNR